MSSSASLSDEEILVPVRVQQRKSLSAELASLSLEGGGGATGVGVPVPRSPPPGVRGGGIGAPPVGTPRPLVVLDLNGILVHRVFVGPAAAGRNGKQAVGSSSLPPPRRPPREPDALHNNSLLYMRRHAREFVGFLLDNFDVAVWSSAQRSNVMAMVELILREPRDVKRLVFVFDQTHCTRAPPTSLPSAATTATPTAKNEKPNFLKELRLVWNTFPEYEHATLLIDDAPSKCVRNPPHTAIHPVEMTADTVDDDTLAVPHGPIATYLARMLDFWQTSPPPPRVSEFVRMHAFPAAM